MFLLFIASSISITEYAYVKNTQQNYTQMLNSAESYFSVREYKTAAFATENIYAKWNNTKNFLNIFLIHNKVEEITESISKLCEYAKTKKYDEYIFESKKIKRQLLSITESELPYLENLL